MTPAREDLELVCLATRRLDDPMPTIVQHLMRAMAERRRVLYVEPPVDPVFLARRRAWARLRPGPGPGHATRMVPCVLPFERRLAGLKPLNRRIVMAQVRRRLRRWRRGQPVLWVPTPSYAWMADALPELPLCYYASDDYRQSPAALAGTTPDALAKLEVRLLERARWVLVNSPVLLGWRRAPVGSTHWVPSGVDVIHFARARDTRTAVPADLAGIPRPIAGFVGAVDAYKVDFALLEACARSLPEISFVTVGPLGWADRTGAGRMPAGRNLHHLGWRPYASLPAYLRGFDVALLPNRTTGYMQANFPMKLFEYFAAGLPVVGTDIPAIRPFARWIRIASGPREFGAAIEAALAGSGEQARAGTFALAVRNSWERQASRVVEILQGGSPDPVLIETSSCAS